jgi:aspartate/methionine/tyrosine aminotransferase
MGLLRQPQLLLARSPNNYWDILFTLFHSSPTNNQPLNLMLGHPNWEPPSFLHPNPYLNQQTLINLLKRDYSGVLQRELVEKNFAVTVGANFALYAAILSLVRKGDEVVCFEPFYPDYYPQTLLAGGSFQGIPLIPPQARKIIGNRVQYEKDKDEWKVDWKNLKQKINPRTRMLVLNNPNNPTGKVFSEEEMEEIADIVKKNPRIVVLNDEVYENCVYEGKMTRFGKIKDMFERTINVYSAGKTFAATGIRVGWYDQ